VNVYDAIHARRDVRRFRTDPLPDDALRRILEAAHSAPSVGYMQPWDFILVRDPATRERVHSSFLRENARAAQGYSGERRELYESLKLEGLREAPLHLCITCDRERGGNVLGRATIRDTDVYSTCLAIQNLWLAARAEGIGVGWVSILRHEIVAECLGLPASVETIAYLCVGYPIDFEERPMLQTVGWRARLSLPSVVHADTYGKRALDLFGDEDP
jgi:5,6-dimethylbenzimidazole synthase